MPHDQRAWIRCEESMPIDGRSVIIAATCGCCGTPWVESAEWDAENGWDFNGDGEGGMGEWKITHWMELPSHPGKGLVKIDD